MREVAFFHVGFLESPFRVCLPGRGTRPYGGGSKERVGEGGGGWGRGGGGRGEEKRFLTAHCPRALSRGVKCSAAGALYVLGRARNGVNQLEVKSDVLKRKPILYVIVLLTLYPFIAMYRHSNMQLDVRFIRC